MAHGVVSLLSAKSAASTAHTHQLGGGLCLIEGEHYAECGDNPIEGAILEWDAFCVGLSKFVGRMCTESSRAAASNSSEMSTPVTAATVRATLRADQPLPVATSRMRSPARALSLWAA